MESIAVSFLVLLGLRIFDHTSSTLGFHSSFIVVDSSRESRFGEYNFFQSTQRAKSAGAHTIFSGTRAQASPRLLTVRGFRVPPILAIDLCGCDSLLGKALSSQIQSSSFADRESLCERKSSIMKFSTFVISCLLAQLAVATNDDAQNLRKTYILPDEPSDEPQIEERRVWIKYKDGARTAALDSISSFSSRSMPPVKFHYDFGEQVGAMVVSATVDEINELASDPSIEDIVDDPKRYPMHIPGSAQPRKLREGAETIPYGITMVQADQAHAAGYLGAGAKVCVVDTGIDAKHEGTIGLS